MSKMKYLLFLFTAIVFCMKSKSQSVQITKEQLIALTPEWKGERFDDGRPKDSFITLSEKPGIGVEINEEGMKKYAIAGVPFFE